MSAPFCYPFADLQLCPQVGPSHQGDLPVRAVQGRGHLQPDRRAHQGHRRQAHCRCALSVLGLGGACARACMRYACCSFWAPRWPSHSGSAPRPSRQSTRSLSAITQRGRPFPRHLLTPCRLAPARPCSHPAVTGIPLNQWRSQFFLHKRRNIFRLQASLDLCKCWLARSAREGLLSCTAIRCVACAAALHQWQGCLA